MKKKIHPKWYPKAKIICACGNVAEVGSTVPEMHVEICSACHPFYTGKHKLVDVAGRVDKFKARLKTAKKIKAEKEAKKKAKKKPKKKAKK